MRTKQRFFLKAAGISLAKVAGISLALVMAFAMFAGCEQDTKIVYRTPENTDPGTGPGTQQPDPVVKEGYLVAKGATAKATVEAFLKGELDYTNSAALKGLYITAPVTIGAPGDSFHLPAGMTIFVTEEANVPKSSIGLLASLFAITSEPPKLTIAGGSLKLDGELVLGDRSDSTKDGSLVIESGATVLVGAGEGALISTTATAGRIDQRGALLFETPNTQKVSIAGELTGDLKKFGTSPGTSVIAVDDDAITNIEPATIGAATNDPDFAGFTPTAASTAGSINPWPANMTTVIYTGTGAVGTVSVPQGAKLIITGAVADGTTDNSITLQGNATLEIASGASIDLGATGTISGPGTVTNNGTITTATPSVGTLNDILAAKGKITATAITVAAGASPTLNVPANTELTITIASVAAEGLLTVGTVPSTSSIDLTVTSNAGTIDLGANEISDLTITNTATGIIKTADDTTLETLLGSVTTGTIEVSGGLAIASATVKGTTTLKVANSDTLTVTGTLTVQTGASVTGAAAGAEIVVGENGSITGAANFYYSNKPTAIASPILEGTYTWATDAGGKDRDDEDIPGWKSDTLDPGTAKIATTAAEVRKHFGDNNITQVTYNASSNASGEPLTGENGTDLTVPPGRTLIINGTINGQAKRIITTDGTITNNGIINTATSGIDETILKNLVSFGGTGSVVWNGVSSARVSIELSGTLTLTQKLTIGQYATLELGTNTISNYAKVTNNGKITTGAATVGDLTPILAAKGKITANAIEVGAAGVPDPDAVLTVPADTTLTITSLTVTEATSELTIVLAEANEDDDEINDGAISGTVTANSGTIKAAKLATVLGLGSISGNVGITGTSEDEGATTTATLDVTTIPTGINLVIPREQTLTVSAALAVNGTGSIANAGIMTVSKEITVSGTGITNSGTIDLGADGSISPYSKVTGSGIIKTAKADGSTLKALLGANGVAGGTVEVSGEVGLTSTQAATVVVDDGVILKVSDKLTVGNNVTLDISAHYDDEDEEAVNPVELVGELVIGSNGTLRLSMGNGSGAIPEITYGSGSLKIEKDGSVKLVDGDDEGSDDDVYIGTGGLYTWTAASVASDQYIMIDTDGITVHGDITSSVLNHVIGKTTIAKTYTLTIGAKVGSMFFIHANGDVQVAGTIKVETDNTPTNIGWIELADENSKLTLLPGGKLDIPAGSSIYTDSMSSESTPRVSVYAVAQGGVGTDAQIVTDEDGGTAAWKLKAGGPSGNAVAITDITLGRLKFSTVLNTAVNNVNGETASPGAAGTLEAGDDTAIVFLGKEEV
jgi:filamentous hemagglutinin